MAANYYIHIPRTGGQSLTSSLPWGHHTYLGHDLRSPDYRHPSEVCTADDFVFTVMRDPFDRLVSAFHFLQRGGWCGADNDDAYRLGIRTLGFRNFVLANLRTADAWQIHFLPQAFFLDGVPSVRVLDFARQAEQFGELCEALGGRREQALLALNRSERGMTEHYYDEATREIVREIYACDFDLMRSALV